MLKRTRQSALTLMATYQQVVDNINAGTVVEITDLTGKVIGCIVSPSVLAELEAPRQVPNR